MIDYKYIRWSILFIFFVIFSLHLTVIVLNHHATTTVSEEIPDYDPHIWGAGVISGSESHTTLCEMRWFAKSPQNNREEISCYVRSVINNLLRTPVNLYLNKNNDYVSIVDLYEVVGDANKTALQKVSKCGYGFDRTKLVPNELIARVCEKAKAAETAAATNSNPASTNSFEIGNILDYEKSKDTAMDRHLSSFMFPGDYLVLDVNATIPNATTEDERMGKDISEGRTTSTNPNARYFRLDYNHTLMLCLFELPPDNILEVVLLDDTDRTSTFSDVDKSVTEHKITKSVNEWLNPLNKAFPTFPSTITARVKAFLGRDGTTRIKDSGFKANSQTYIDTQFGSGATVDSILQVAEGTKSSSSSNLKKVIYVHMKKRKKTDLPGLIAEVDAPLIFSIIEDFMNRSDENFACVTGSLHTYKHEIGHMLHMDHYYQGRINSANEMLSFTSLPSKTKPLPVNKCSFDVPYTVMYTEPNVTDLDAAFVQHMWAYMYNGTKYPSKPISDPENDWASRVNVFDNSGSPLPDPKQWDPPFHPHCIADIDGNPNDRTLEKTRINCTTRMNERPKGTEERLYYFSMFMKESLPFDIIALVFNAINLYLAFRVHSIDASYYKIILSILSFFLPTAIIGTILIGGLLIESGPNRSNVHPDAYRASFLIMLLIFSFYGFILLVSRPKRSQGQGQTAANQGVRPSPPNLNWVPIVIVMQAIVLNITYYVFLLERHTAWEECKQTGDAFHSENIEIIISVLIALSVVFLFMCVLYFALGSQRSSVEVQFNDVRQII